MMVTIAHGTKQVADLEKALGGNPPPLALIKKMSSEMFQKRILTIQKRISAREEFKPLRDEQAKAAVSQAGIGRFANDKAYNEILKKLRLRRKGRKHPVPKFPRMESRVEAGSLNWIKVAPYDFTYTNRNGVGLFSMAADKDKGQCLAEAACDVLTSKGEAAIAAVGVLFYSNQFSQSLRFSAFTWRHFVLKTYAAGLFDSVHAEYHINLYIQELTGANAGVYWGQPLIPGLSQTSYFWSHGYDEDEMYQAMFADFPVYEGWYVIWVGVEAEADGGYAESDIALHVPFVKFYIP